MATLARLQRIAVAGIALVMAMLVLSVGAAPAGAASIAAPTMTFDSLGAGGAFTGATTPAGYDGIVGTADDAAPFGGAGVQLLGEIDTGVDTIAVETYCIDLATPIDIGEDTFIGTWSEAVGVVPPDGRTNQLTPQGLSQIAMVVANNFPNPDTLAPLVGSDNDKALAVQWAIWHYANGFTPGVADAVGNLGTFGVFPTTPTNVDVNYTTILNAVATNQYPSVPEPVTPSLGLTEPPRLSGTQSLHLIGPFTVQTNPGVAVTVTASGSGVLSDANGSPISGPFSDGEEIWVRSTAAETVNLTATASMVIPVGATFVDPDVQRLVNTSAVTGTFATTASATFTPLPDAPSVRAEKYVSDLEFAPNPSVRTADKAANRPAGDADTDQTSLAVNPDTSTPVRLTFNNNGRSPLYDVTIRDRTVSGTGALTGLVCQFPDASTGGYFAGPFEPGAVIQCTATLPRLGHGAHHANEAAIYARPGIVDAGTSTPDPQNPATGLPINPSETTVISDIDQLHLWTAPLESPTVPDSETITNTPDPNAVAAFLNYLAELERQRTQSTDVQRPIRSTYGAPATTLAYTGTNTRALSAWAFAVTSAGVALLWSSRARRRRELTDRTVRSTS